MQPAPATFGRRSPSSAGRKACWSGVAVVAAMMALLVQRAAADVPDGAMEKFLARSADSHQYRALRRLEATGCGQTGWLDAQTVFTPGAGLRYEIAAEGGSGYIRSRVLRTLLDEEQQLIARGAAGDVAISSANYRFKPAGVNEDGFALVDLQPLRKERALIVGRMFLTLDDGDLVRVEGRLAKNPSFWLSRATMVRSYRRLNGVLVPVSLQSIGQLRFLGQSTLRMTYHYTEVDDRPVADDSAK